ncbi:hypothetical protein HDIA_3642 [Hartmannibacter diazotrophicus]|uniref:Uncharacterized protein n=1 Tax=Hartmannibacter diazotrophicus TaxID=1482074 RepID=A0A2C9DAC5_9HYPH|nr:hypothetical protein HDIA_3642 [Hartmannibacter diazotrophicus]
MPVRLPIKKEPDSVDQRTQGISGDDLPPAHGTPFLEQGLHDHPKASRI